MSQSTSTGRGKGGQRTKRRTPTSNVEDEGKANTSNYTHFNYIYFLISRVIF